MKTRALLVQNSVRAALRSRVVNPKTRGLRSRKVTRGHEGSRGHEGLEGHGRSERLAEGEEADRLEAVAEGEVEDVTVTFGQTRRNTELR